MIKIKEILENRNDDTPIYFTYQVLDMLNISKKTLDRYRKIVSCSNVNKDKQKRRYSAKEIAEIIDIIKLMNGINSR